MASGKTYAVGAAALAAAVLGLIALLPSGNSSAPESAPASAPAPGARADLPAAPTAASRERPPAPKRLAGKPPALPAPDPNAAPPWVEFDDQVRDPAWAEAQEGRVRARLGPLLDGANRGNPGAVEVPQVECRATSCRLLVTGRDEFAFRVFVETLQDERGFYGDASQLALHGYGTQIDKDTQQSTHVVHVHLSYER